MNRAMEWVPECLGGLVGLAVGVPLVYASILRNLPRDLEMTPVEETEIPLDLFPHMARYEDLGFQRLGAWRLRVPAGPTIVAYFRPGEGTFGTVFGLRKAPGKVFYDFTTRLAPEPCTLTTGMHVAGGSLTPAVEDFLQLFPRAPVEELHALHLEGVAYLCAAGLAMRAPDPDAYEESLRDSIRRQREAFRAARARNTLATLWRAVSQSSPYRGPVGAQGGTRARIEAALGRRSRDELLELHSA